MKATSVLMYLTGQILSFIRLAVYNDLPELGKYFSSIFFLFFVDFYG